MAASIETKRKLRAIRRLSMSFPDRTAEERLEKIEGIASGKLDASIIRHGPSPDLAKRLAAGQASRAVRNALDTKPVKKAKADEEDEEKRRKEKKGRDRKERDGIVRSVDVNL